MTISLTRRAVLASGLAAGLALAALPAFAQDKPVLRFSAVFSDKDIRAQMTQKFAEAIGDDFTLRALLRRQPLQAGHRARRAAARQPRDGQHRAAGHRQPGAGVLDPDRGLRLPRRRPHARLLRQRLRQGDGRPRRGAARDQDPRPHLLRHPPGRAEAGQGDQDPRRHGRDQAPHARRRRLAVPRAGARRQPDADGLRRGLHRPADRRHRRPGQPAAERAEHEVLRGDEPDRADLAPRRLRPPHHLEDRLGQDDPRAAGERCRRRRRRRSTGARPST